MPTNRHTAHVIYTTNYHNNRAPLPIGVSWSTKLKVVSHLEAAQSYLGSLAIGQLPAAPEPEQTWQLLPHNLMESSLQDLTVHIFGCVKTTKGWVVVASCKGAWHDLH